MATFICTLNGHDYYDENFYSSENPYAYSSATGLRQVMTDLATVAAGIAAAAGSGGVFLNNVSISANAVTTSIYDTTSYATGIGGILNLDFKNGSGTQKTGGRVSAYATTGTNGAEVANLRLWSMRAGTLTAAWDVLGSGAFAPVTDGGAALGTASQRISGADFSLGAVIRFNNAGTVTHATGRLTSTMALTVSDNTASTTTTTGSGVFSGGVGIAGALNVGSTLGVAAAVTVTSTAAAALAVGRQGATDPVLKVDAATGSVATGILITGAAAASRVVLAAISSGTDEGISINAKGSGTIRMGPTSTGAIEFSRNAVPTANDGAALGTSALQWSDADFASGAVIRFNNAGTVTHATGRLTSTMALTVSDNTASTTTTTGSGVFSGGVGIAGAVNIGGALNVTGNATFTKFIIGANTTYAFEVAASNSGDYVMRVNNTNATNPRVMTFQIPNATGGSGNYYFIGADSGGNKVIVTGDGNIQNANNSYGAISARSMKRDIVPAASYFDRLMATRLKNYHLKSDRPDATIRLGVIADDQEDLWPELINHHGDGPDTFNYMGLLIPTVQALQMHVDATAGKFRNIEDRMSNIERRINQ